MLPAMESRGSEVLGPMSEPHLSQAGKLAGTMLSQQVGTQGRSLAGVGEVRNIVLSDGGCMVGYIAWGGAGMKLCLQGVQPHCTGAGNADKCCL